MHESQLRPGYRGGTHLAGLGAGTAWRAAFAQEPPEPSAVDLATVPLHPSELPERGYQLAQAGDLELSAVEFAWSPEGADSDDWEPIADHFLNGYSTVHFLLSDRADSRSEPLATVTTTIIGLDESGSAEEAVQALLDIAGFSPTEEVEGVTVYSDIDGFLGLRAEGDYVVAVQYASPAQKQSTQQNTSDWTSESVAEVVVATTDRLATAIDVAGSGDSGFGIANVMVYGQDSPWTLPWIYYPSTEHYRVLKGEIVPYGGEIDVRDADDVADGVEDLFVSRQQIGAENYEHLIDITLARFDSEEDAVAFAKEPAPVSFPPTWTFDPAYTEVSETGDVVRIDRVRVDDDALRASGFRSVRQDGEVVQVVQWLASGNAVVTEEALAWLTGVQSACLDALPEPCAPIGQDTLPAALNESGAPGSDRLKDQATPEASATANDVLVSEQFDWQVAVPDDGWKLTDTEIYTNSEFFELQSDRSLITVESVVDHHGDPQQCILDNLALLETLEERAAIDLGSDDPEERTAGIEQDHGWAIYTVEPLQEERADQEYTIRFDCYTLVDGDASLVVTHTAPRELWTAERDKGERFRDGIELPESSAIVPVTPPAGDGRHIGRTLTMGIPRIWIPLAA